MRNYTIAIDFDGTIVEHRYPKIGEPLKYAKETINALAEKGHKIFLYTMRDGNTLADAKDFLKTNGYKINFFNESPAQFNNSPKLYAQLYIDDAALGCPYNEHGVDWAKVVEILYTYGLLDNNDVKKIIS